MGWLVEKWQTEPVLVIDFVKLLVALIATFGFALTNEQEVALFSVLFGFSYLTRSRVTPNANLQAATVQSAKDGEKP